MDASWTNSLSFRPDGMTLALADSTAGVRLWDVDGHEWRTLPGSQGAFAGSFVTYHLGGSFVTNHPNGELLLVVSHNGTVRIWDVATGEELDGLRQTYSGNVTAMGLTPDQEVFAAAQDGAMRFYDLATGAENRHFRTVTGNDLYRDQATVSQDGQWVAYSGAALIPMEGGLQLTDMNGNSLIVVNAATGAVQYQLETT
jgi:WD40 repeat protein